MDNNPKTILVHVTTVPESLYFFLKGQAHFMIQQGVEVHCVSSRGALLDLFADREKAIPHAIDMPRAISPFRDLVALWRLYRLFRKIKPDIVHAHTPKGGLLGTVAALFAGVSVRLYHVHGLPYVTAKGVKRAVFKSVEKISCHIAQKIFCVSNSLAEEVRKEICSKPEKVHVLLSGSINGVDAGDQFNPMHYDGGTIRDQYGIPRHALVVGFVGRLVRDKGILELLESWQDLRSMYSGLHLMLVGPFEEKDGIGGDAKEKLYSDDRVHVVGPVIDPAPFYAAMDVLAFPTHREGFGLVAIEASAMRLPVVATRIPGCFDSVVDGMTGTLVSCRNTAALTAGLRKYLDSSEIRSAHGEAGRKRAMEEFVPQSMWEALYGEYIAMLSEYRGTPP